MNIRVRESLTSCVAFHFLRASCFHHIRSLTGIKGTEKKSGAGVGCASGGSARHVNAGVYNNGGMYLLRVARCCAGTKSEALTSLFADGEKNRERIQAGCKRRV